MSNTNENMTQESLKEILIRKLGIYELRAVAREIGIPSPTTKRRNELVDLIVENRNRLQSGMIANLTLTRKGRPYKKLSSLDKIISAVSFDDETLPNQIQKPAPSYDSLICFAQEIPNFEKVGKNERILKGVLRKANSAAYFIDTEEGIKVFVPDDLTERYNLSQGDLLSTRSSQINSQGQYIVNEILEVNFKRIEDHKVKDIPLANPIISREKLQFGYASISCGRRNAVKFATDIFEDSRFEALCKDCKDRKIKVIVLGLNISFENDILYRSIDNVTSLTTTYGTHCASGLDRVVDTIALCQKLTQRGHKVLLFINDIVELLRTLDKYYGSSEQSDGHSVESVVVAQKLLSLGRAYDNGLWTTLLVAYRDSDAKETFLNNELFKVSAKID